MELKFEKGSESKDNGKEQNDAQSNLFASAYDSLSAAKLLVSSTKSVSTDSYLPKITIVDELKEQAQSGIRAENSKLGSALDALVQGKLPTKGIDLDTLLGSDQSAASGALPTGTGADLLGRAGNVPTERRGSDPRAASEGSPGWDDFGFKPPEVHDDSIWGTIKEALAPDYAAGDNVGGNRVRGALNDANPPRNLRDVFLPEDPETHSPLIPVEKVAEGAGKAYDYFRAKAQKSDDAQRKYDQDVNGDPDVREPKEPRTPSAQKESDQSKKDSTPDNPDGHETQRSEDQKKKDTGTSRPNPDADRPEVSRAQIEADRATLRDQRAPVLPTKPGAGDARANAPKFGAVRSNDFLSNPAPNNDGNPNTSDSTVQRLVPKVDVRNGGPAGF